MADRSTFVADTEPYMRPLYSTAVRLTTNSSDAEDLVQETYLRAYAAWASFEPGSNCRAWLIRILMNSYINHYRRARSHRDADNPLRAHGRLAAVCGIEYAAQGMAVHGALLAPPGSSRARVGYLVSVRGAQLHVPRLDDIAADLLVEAACITRGENNILYQFSVSAMGQTLLTGRAAVVLDADKLTAGEAP